MELPRLIAHRGVSAQAPENTLAAIKMALSLGAQWVETDVQLTADNQPVIFHDDELDRVTNGVGVLNHFPLEVLKTLDAGSWFDNRFAGERIPTLQELIVLLTHNNVRLNLELKPVNENAADLVPAVANTLNAYWPDGIDKPLISSFDWNCLYDFQAIASHYPRALLLHTWREDWLIHAKALKPVSINVNEAILTAQRVKEILDAGFSVLAYTVNSVDRARQLREWGVYGFFTDDITKLKAFEL